MRSFIVYIPGQGPLRQHGRDDFTVMQNLYPVVDCLTVGPFHSLYEVQDHRGLSQIIEVQEVFTQ